MLITTAVLFEDTSRSRSDTNPGLLLVFRHQRGKYPDKDRASRRLRCVSLYLSPDWPGRAKISKEAIL